MMSSSEQEHGENGKMRLSQEGNMSNVVIAYPVTKKSTTAVKKAATNALKATIKKPYATKKSRAGFTSCSHPPYSDMVVASIKSLSSYTGVSRQAIIKKIKEDYDLGDNETMISNWVKITLKKGLKSGMLKKAAAEGRKGAGCYKLGDQAMSRERFKSNAKSVTAGSASNMFQSNDDNTVSQGVVDQQEDEIVIISDDDTSSGVGTSSPVINTLESKENIKIEEDVIYLNEDDNATDGDVISEFVHHNPITNQTDPSYVRDGNMLRSWNREFSKNLLKPADNRKLSNRKLPMESVGNINTKSKVRPAINARSSESDLRSSWVVTTWNIYRNKGKMYTVDRFWKEHFVHLVLSAIHVNSLSRDQAAVILGVSVKEFRLRLSSTRLTQNIASSNFNCGNYILKAEESLLTEDWLTPEVVDHLLRVTFKSKDRIIFKDEPSILRPSLNFYTDNFDRVCCEIEEAYSRHETLQNSTVLRELRSTLVALDSHGLNSKSSPQVIALIPAYNFTKHMIEKPRLQYWNTDLPSLLLCDVRSKVLPVEVAAWQLGVSKQMVLCCLANTSKDRDPGEILSVKRYMERGFGDRKMFWKEKPIWEIMGRVKNREMAVGEAAAMLGVARSEVVVRCGGVKTQEEVDNEKKILELEKFNSRVEKMSYVRKVTPLEKQIALAENQEGSLSDYEMMRLENMRERQKLLEQLDIHKEKRIIAEDNKKMAIFTPKNCFKQREPSKRIRLRNESTVVGSNFDNYCSSSRTSRMSPPWVGQWLPLKVSGNNRKNLAVDIQKGKVPPRFYTPDVGKAIGKAVGKTFGDIYDLETLDLACHVPTVDMAISEVMEVKKDLQNSLAILDSLSAECKEVKYKPQYIESTGSSLAGLVQIQDSNIVSAPITSLDTCWDMIAHGSTRGDVGIQIETTVLTWRPHNRSVTRVLLTGGSHNLSLLSSSGDGSVRRTDLTKQIVLVEHYGTSAVFQMEKYTQDSFLLNLGHEISVMDLRNRNVCKVLELSETENSGDNSSLAVNPSNNNIISVCLDSSVRIYDLRNSSHVVNFLPGSFCQSQWSPHSAKQFLTVKKKGLKFPASWKLNMPVNREGYIVDVYYSGDLNTSTFSKEIDEKQSSRGIYWNPWHESSLLLSDPSNAVSSLGKSVVVSVDSVTGQETDRLEVEVGSHPYLLHSHVTRPVLVIGNNRRPGGLAVYSK